MLKTSWLENSTPAFRLMIATSWLAPDSWRKQQDAAIQEAAGAHPDWEEYLRLVDHHRTPALSWKSLSRVNGLEIPQFAQQALQKNNNACRIEAIRHSLFLAQILKAFNQAEIPVMSLKGGILSITLYGDVGLRQSHDMDLAVMPEDLHRAQSCLQDQGWRLDSAFFPMTPGQRKRFWQIEHHLGFTHTQKDCALELHWRNSWEFSGSSRACWDRSIPSVWQGCSYQAMNPIDQVLYLCSHGGEHAWFRAKWLGDLARIHAAGSVDWEEALEQARRTEQDKPLLVCLRLLHIVHGLPLPQLRGNPWKSLPPFLMSSPLYALKYSAGRPEEKNPEILPVRVRLAIDYERIFLSRRIWRKGFSVLAYNSEDYKNIHLPHSFFWSYWPLKPLLWAWGEFSRIWAR